MYVSTVPCCCSVANIGDFEYSGCSSKEFRDIFRETLDNFFKYDHDSKELPLVYMAQTVKGESPLVDTNLKKLGFVSKEVPSRHPGKILNFYYKEFKDEKDLLDWFNKL